MAISELMKQTEDGAPKRRFDVNELSSARSSKTSAIKWKPFALPRTNPGGRLITRKVESLEIKLGTLEREFQPIQKFSKLEDKCTELELEWLSRLIEHKLGDEGSPKRIEPLAVEFLESDATDEKVRFGRGNFPTRFSRNTDHRSIRATNLGSRTQR